MGTGHERALRAAGVRVTRQRLAVLRALEGRDEAVTAQQLHREMSKHPGAPGLTTVYRTLTALAAAGEVDTFRREGDAESAFRLCGERHHHHLLCEACGGVQEVSGPEVEAWVSRVARRRGFRVTGHQADIYGICRSCR